MRARMVSKGGKGADHGSLGNAHREDADEFNDVDEAMGWCEQQIADVLAERRAMLKLVRTPGVCKRLLGCKRLFGRRLL